MKTVYKFPVQITDRQDILMPAGAQIVHAGLDPSGGTCLWALVDPDKLPELRHIAVTGTGTPVPDGVIHRGSLTDGIFVWHIWEVLD